MEIFPDAQGKAHSAVPCPIWQNFELIRNFTVVCLTCKNKEDLIKNECDRMVTRFFPIITLWERTVAMETRALIRSIPKPNAAFLPPQ